MWTLAYINAGIIKRSNALLNYGSKIVYKEAFLYPNFMAGFNRSFGMIIMFTGLGCAPLRWIM